MASRVSKFSLKQLRAFTRTQNADITINSAVGLQANAQKQREKGDDPRSNADALISYSALGLVTAYYVYYLGAANYWTIAYASTFSNSGSGYLLGIASPAAYPDNSPAASSGVFLKGILKIPTTYFAGTPAVGAPIYLSTSAGTYTFTAPSSSGNIVKVLGHCLNIGDDGTMITMYFNPDKTWVEV